MAFMKFYVGNEANASSHLDGIYIAIDTKKIYYNGDAYGGKEIDLSDYVTLDGLQTITGTKIFSNGSFLRLYSTSSTGSSAEGLACPISILNPNYSDNRTFTGLSYNGMRVQSQYGEAYYRVSGVEIRGKTSSDLLHAAGGTISISDIVTQVTAAIVDGAPTTLDTLNELAAALGDDPNFATTITNEIAKRQVTNISYTTQANDDGSSELIIGQINIYGSNEQISSAPSIQVPYVTQEKAGVMSAEDKTKLDNYPNYSELLEFLGIVLVDLPPFPTSRVTAGSCMSNPSGDLNLVNGLSTDKNLYIFGIVSGQRVHDLISCGTGNYSIPSQYSSIFTSLTGNPKFKDVIIFDNTLTSGGKYFVPVNENTKLYRCETLIDAIRHLNSDPIS